MKTEVVPLRVTSGVLKKIEEEEYSLQSIRDGIGLLEEEVKKHRHGKEHSGENLVALALWMNYCQADGRTFEELVERVGKERVEVILKSVVDTNFREFNDHQLVEILNFLELVVSNSQVEVANHWLSKAFSQEIWKHLSKLYLKNLFSTYKKFIREYEALIKHKSSKEDTISAKLLPNILELFGHKFSSLSYDILEPEVKTCEKILEFILICLSNAQSRLPTLMTLQDKQFYLKNSLFLKYLTVLYGEDKKASSLLGNIRQLFRLLKRFVHYDILGESRVARRTLLVHYDTFQEFQRLLFHHFSEKVEHYVIKAVGNTDTREKMAEIFSYLTEADLRLIANKLNIFVPEEDDSDPVLQILTEQKGFKIIVEEILISKLKSRQSFLQEVKSEPLYPTEVELFDRFSNQITNKGQFLDYRQGFAIDRITNSYTNLEDYLFRHFSLWRELFKLETRSEVEEVVSKVNPVFDSITGIVKEFGGWTPNSIETKNFTVYEVAKPKIGSLVADHILAEVDYSTVGINSTVKKDWEKLQHGDVMFLMAFSRQKDGGISNELEETVEIMSQTGLCLVRGCEVVGHLDEERSKIHSSEFRRKVEVKPKGTQRHIQLHLDPNQFARDLTRGSKLARDSMYSLVLKRKSNGPNYIGFLRLILHFLEQNVEIPFWVNLLIVGRPFAAVKDKIANELDKKLTTKGLFSDQSQHKVFTSSQAFKSISSHFEHEKFHEERSTTRNKLTDEQLEVVTRSLLPGALVVDAPPGSGKSLLSAEIVCQTLLNFPDERIVIVTRSEGELTEVLREIGNTGLVPEDEIMRLGETEEVGSGPDYTRAGRVNYMLKRRLELIEQAEQIAVDLGLPQGTKLTCETAEILYQSQIASRWKDFESKLNGANKSEKLEYPFCKLTFMKCQF
jgi:intron-binding protein aquarius